MEQYKIKAFVNYLKNRLVLSNEIVKNLNMKTITLDDYLKGIKLPKYLVTTKRDINLIQLTNDEIDEFVGILELLLNRYEINDKTNNTSFINYVNTVINQLLFKLDTDQNYVARELLKEKLNRFRAMTINGIPNYGINPNIQGNIKVTEDSVVVSNKDLKKSVRSSEDALLFGFSLMHRNTEILANSLYTGFVNGELRIISPCEYYFYDMVSNNMYGISEVDHMQPLNSYLEAQDLELMVNGYYTYDRLVKILGHIQRLRDMSKDEKAAILNLSVQGSLNLTEYISNNTNIFNSELDETRIYLQKYFYDRLVRKGQTDLRMVPNLDHGHPLDRALVYGGIDPERCNINLFMKITDHDINTRVGHFSSVGLQYEDSVTVYEMGHQYRKW